MEKQKMTIHRGLAELKLINSRIENQISTIANVGIYQKNKLINGVIPMDEFHSLAHSKLESAKDLISRRSAIKSAIVEANGRTMVMIAGKQMTIADAINYKQEIVFKKALIARIRGVYNNVVAELNKRNTIVEQNTQKLLEAAFGKENVKISKEDMDAVRVPYMAANEFLLFDPLESMKLVETTEKEVMDFEVEVDAVLSEVNAITFIEV